MFVFPIAYLTIFISSLQEGVSAVTTSQLSLFETVSLGLGFVQTALLAITVACAWTIGKRQAALQKQQNDLTDLLTSLERFPSVSITVSGERLHVKNEGRFNLWLWGNASDAGRDLNEHPVLIAPGGFYYIPAEPLVTYARRRMGTGSEVRLDYRFFLTDSTGREFVAFVTFYCKVAGQVLECHSQLTGLEQQLWRSDAKER